MVLLIVLLFPMEAVAQSLCEGPFTWGYCPPKSAAKTEHPNADPRGTDERPFAVKIIRTEEDSKVTKQQAADDDAKASRERQLIWATWWIAVATTLLMGGTVYLARYTFLLWNDAQETSERQLRAYLGFFAAEVALPKVGRKLDEVKYTVVAHYKNGGRTPAHDNQGFVFSRRC